MATSLGVADAITRGSLSPFDLSLWQRIFQHTFGRTVDEELKEGGRSIWKVNAQWESLPSNRRFIFIEREQELQLRSWELHD